MTMLSSNSIIIDSTSDDNVSDVSRTFTVFDKLPIELRAAIWQLSLVSRNVELHFETTSVGRPFYTFCPPPPILEVCKESRCLILPHYPKCFGTTMTPGLIRFNLGLDVLVLPFDSLKISTTYLFDIMTSDELVRLSYLAVPSIYLHMWSETENRWFRSVLRRLEGLQNLFITLFVQHDPYRSHECRSNCIQISEDILQDVETTGIERHEDAFENWEEFEIWDPPRCRIMFLWYACGNLINHPWNG